MTDEFKRTFWLEKYAEDQKEPDHRVAIINGTHYYIDNEDAEGYFRGFGGAEFIIEFNDGAIVKTTNLWCQGNIPDEFKDLFPNNAKFVNIEGEWKRIGSCYYLV